MTASIMMAASDTRENTMVGPSMPKSERVRTKTPAAPHITPDSIGRRRSADFMDGRWIRGYFMVDCGKSLDTSFGIGYCKTGLFDLCIMCRVSVCA